MKEKILATIATIAIIIIAIGALIGIIKLLTPVFGKILKAIEPPQIPPCLQVETVYYGDYAGVDKYLSDSLEEAKNIAGGIPIYPREHCVLRANRN